MPTTATRKIGSKHQITIPKKIFDELNLKIGDYLEFQAEKDRIVVIPQKLISKNHTHTEECE